MRFSGLFSLPVHKNGDRIIIQDSNVTGLVLILDIWMPDNWAFTVYRSFLIQMGFGKPILFKPFHIVRAT